MDLFKQHEPELPLSIDAELAALRATLGDLDEGETPDGMFDQPAE